MLFRSDKEPAYWGIVFPLDSRKLYLPDSTSSSRSSSVSTSKPASPRSATAPPLDIMMMPVMVGTWLGGGTTAANGAAGGGGSSTGGTVVGRHSTTTCLSCCRLQPSARPRAASLSITKDDIRSSLLLSGILDYLIMAHWRSFWTWSVILSPDSSDLWSFKSVLRQNRKLSLKSYFLRNFLPKYCYINGISKIPNW